jgi:hypothetical protein
MTMTAARCINGHDITAPSAMKKEADGRLRCRLCRNEASRRYRVGTLAAPDAPRVSDRYIPPRRFDETPKRAPKAKAVPVRSTPCHVCGSDNHDVARVDRCRLCGSELGKYRFGREGTGGLPWVGYGSLRE